LLNGATVLQETKSTPEDAHEAAQRVDYVRKERASIDAATWRRFASGAMVLALLAVVVAAILANKYTHEVFVFRETKNGLSYAGQASQELSPSNFAIGAQLGAWVRAYRNVPGDDATVDNNVILLEASTADYGQEHALSDLKAYLSANNPKVLRKDFTRTVRLNVDALHQPGANTWNVTWIEDVTKKNGVQQPPTIHTGALVILPDLRLPTDQEHVSADPAGVTVVHYEIH
jgi:type IV secretory pathway TrbF-like protein